VWLVAAAPKTTDVRAIGRWELEGKSERQSNLARKIAGVSEAIPVNLNSKSLMVKIRGFLF
jgi:hypothetical protein